MPHQDQHQDENKKRTIKKKLPDIRSFRLFAANFFRLLLLQPYKLAQLAVLYERLFFVEKRNVLKKNVDAVIKLQVFVSGRTRAKKSGSVRVCVCGKTIFQSVM